MKPRITIYLMMLLVLGLLLSPSPSAQNNEQAGTPSDQQSDGQTGQQAGARGARQTMAAMSPEQFLRHAMMSNLAEIEHGRLASERASNSQVKQFAQHMVESHQKANDELRPIAKKKGITVPTALDAEHRQTHDRLSKLQGAEFDRAYMDHMVQAHRMDVEAFEYQAKNSKDQEVRRMASTKAPELRQHLQMATDTRQQVGGTRRAE